MPTEKFLEKVEGESLKNLLRDYQKTFKELWEKKKYAEAYILTVTIAKEERGSPIDEASVNMLTKAISEGYSSIKKFFTVEFKKRLIDSDAPLTAKAMIDVIQSTSLFASFAPAIFMLAVIGIAIKTTK
jgi:hypothetical protein